METNKSDLACETVRDLMPLVKDALASLASRESVEEHLKACPACAKEWEALKNEEAPALESAPLEKLNEKLNKRSLERALLWALSALLIASLILITLTHRTPLPYHAGMLALHTVPGQKEQALYISDRAAEYSVESVRGIETDEKETLVSAWTTPLSRLRGAAMPRSTLVTGEVWYTSFEGLDTRVVPEGTDNAQPSNRMTLPRLALAYYLYVSAAALAVALIARFLIKKQSARRWADAAALLFACYIAAHVLVMGFTTVSCFMTRDFLCILWVAALLFGALWLAMKRRKGNAVPSR